MPAAGCIRIASARAAARAQRLAIADFSEDLRHELLRALGFGAIRRQFADCAATFDDRQRTTRLEGCEPLDERLRPGGCDRHGLDDGYTESGRKLRNIEPEPALPREIAPVQGNDHRVAKPPHLEDEAQ